MTRPQRRAGQAEPSDGREESPLEVEEQLRALNQKYTELLNLQNTQKEELENQNRDLRMEIQALTNKNPETRNGPNSVRTTVPKAPTLQSFSGKASEKNSTSVQAFFFRIKKAAQFAAMDEQSTLSLAICHLDGRAATWYMRLEASTQAPSTIDELKGLMFKEFVPSIERSQAKMALVSLKMNYSDDIDKHIDKFEELMEKSGTDMSKGYSYFFLTLPDTFKVDLTKFFEGEEPEDIHSAYKRVRTLGLTRAWSNPMKKRSEMKYSPELKQQDKNSSKTHRGKNSNAPPRELDPNDPSWGPTKNKFEARKYREADRCFKCGMVGWSDPDHPCRNIKKLGNPSKN